MRNLKSKINKQNRNRLTDTENRLITARWEGFGRLGETGAGIRGTNWQLQNSHEDVRYSIGNVVNNIVITKYGASLLLEISRGSLCKVYDCLTTMLYP